MYYIVKHEGEEVGSVMSNRSLSDWDVIELAGIDIEEMEDPNTPKWDLEAFEIESVSTEEYLATH